MVSVYKNAGERILATRQTQGYTRETLAELANISPKFLYEIETGKKGFSALVLYNLCTALNVECDYILTGKPTAEYDICLVNILKSFEKEQTEKIAYILKQIYELI